MGAAVQQRAPAGTRCQFAAAGASQGVPGLVIMAPGPRSPSSTGSTCGQVWQGTHRSVGLVQLGIGRAHLWQPPSSHLLAHQHLQWGMELVPSAAQAAELLPGGRPLRRRHAAAQAAGAVLPRGLGRALAGQAAATAAAARAAACWAGRAAGGQWLLRAAARATPTGAAGSRSGQWWVCGRGGLRQLGPASSCLSSAAAAARRPFFRPAGSGHRSGCSWAGGLLPWAAAGTASLPRRKAAPAAPAARRAGGSGEARCQTPAESRLRALTPRCFI